MKYFKPRPLRPDRLRVLERPFGWIPFRFLKSGWLQQLDRGATLVYFFLCLVADNKGLSFYGDTRLSRLLGMSETALAMARKQLCDRDLLAFDGRVYQLLSLPHEPAEPNQAHQSRNGNIESVGWILQRLRDEE